jgi:putative MATE family efflux protein
MYVGTLINLVNIGLCWTFVTGFGTLPTLGWPGLALGTSLAFSVGCLYALVRLTYGVGDLRLGWRRMRWEPRVAWRILRIGIPGAAASVGLVLCHLAFVRLVGGLGETAFAAHGVAIQVESLSYLLGEAFAYATAALVGQALGAKRPALARQCAWAGIRGGALCMGGMGVLFVLFGPTLCGLFTTVPEVATLGGSVVRIMGWVEAPLGALIVLNGVLRGAGDTRVLLAVSAVGLLLVRVPLAYWFASPTIGWGLWGAWLAMAIDVNMRFALAGWRFLGDRWMRQRV